MERICFRAMKHGPSFITKKSLIYKNAVFNKRYLLSQDQLINSFKITNANTYKTSSFLNSSLDQSQNVPVKKNEEDQKSILDKQKPVEDLGEIVQKWYKKYQDFVGISEILGAQDKVSLLTNELMEIQSKRRKLQREVEDVHEQLLATHQRITKSELYSEDHYALFEKARQLNNCLKTLQQQFIQTEEEERNLFTQLSTAIKYCHEKERTQSEQSKYWSILISVISATLAALITSINNWVRIREIKDHSSILHRDAVSRAEEIRRVLTEFLEGGRNSVLGETVTDGKAPSSERITMQSIQSAVSAEVNKITDVLRMNLKGPINPEVPPAESQEVGYLSIACSMLSGAFLGILITYNFFGSGGGGPG